MGKTALWWDTEEGWQEFLNKGLEEGQKQLKDDLYSKDPNVVRSAKIAVQAGALLPGTVVPVRKGKV